MLKVENVEVLGWEHAIRGMRNPKNSWAKSDSGPECPYEKEKCCGECQQNFCIGPNDKQLMMALRNAGTDHRKFMRMITVYLDITANHLSLYSDATSQPNYRLSECLS